MTTPPVVTTLQPTLQTFHKDGYLHLPSLLTSAAFIAQLRAECLDIFHATLDWLYVSGASKFPESVRISSIVDGAAENNYEMKAVPDDTVLVAAGSSAQNVSDSGGGFNKYRYEYPIKQGLKNGYRELVMRSDGRYELALLLDDPRRNARSDAVKNHDGDDICNNYDEQQKVDSKFEGETNDSCYSYYNGKRLMTVDMIERAKRQFITANNNANGEPLCKEMDCSGNETSVKMDASSMRNRPSCLLQLLRWIQQYEMMNIADKNSKNDNTIQDDEHKTEENIIDEKSFKSFMELVSAIFQTTDLQHQQSNGNDNDFYLCNLSLLISTPGSSTQPWHADGGHTSLKTHLPCHVFNVFIPLVDVPLSMGPTELRPGSHVYTRDLARMMLIAKVKKELRGTVVPELRRGDALVFDYRILHRGRANLSDKNDGDEDGDGGEGEEGSQDDGDGDEDGTSNKSKMKRGKDRPVLVLTFARRWFVDVCNFPKRSIFSIVENR